MEAKYTVEPFSSKQLAQWKSAQPHPAIDYPLPNALIPNELKHVQGLCLFCPAASSFLLHLIIASPCMICPGS